MLAIRMKHSVHYFFAPAIKSPPRLAQPPLHSQARASRAIISSHLGCKADHALPSPSIDLLNQAPL
jgi:hypothetical protein